MTILPPLMSLVVVLLAAGCVYGMLHAIAGAVHAETDVHDLRCQVAHRLEIRRLKMLEAHGGGVGEVEVLEDETDDPTPDTGDTAEAFELPAGEPQPDPEPRPEPAAAAA